MRQLIESASNYALSVPFKKAILLYISRTECGARGSRQGKDQQRWGENTAGSRLGSWVPTALQGARPTPAGWQPGVKTHLWVGWPSGLPPHLDFCGDLFVRKSLRTLEENPHMVAAGLCPLRVQEPQEELDRNPGILGPACPQLVDQDPTRERGKPMRAGPFLSEVEVSLRP